MEYVIAAASSCPQTLFMPAGSALVGVLTKPKELFAEIIGLFLILCLNEFNVTWYYSVMCPGIACMVKEPIS